MSLKTLKISLLLTLVSLLAIASYWPMRELGVLTLPSSIKNTQLIQNEFQHKDKVFVKDIFPYPWKYVCNVLPFTGAEDVLGDGKALDINITPFDYKLREQYWGLVLIDDNNAVFLKSIKER